MTCIHFIEHDGTAHRVQADDGSSVMQTALDHSVPGILGDCGGTCSCATCHGYVDDAFLPRLAPPGELERSILDGMIDVRADSRLTCQIRVGPEIEGLVVRLPASQDA